MGNLHTSGAGTSSRVESSKKHRKASSGSDSISPRKKNSQPSFSRNVLFLGLDSAGTLIHSLVFETFVIGFGSQVDTALNSYKLFTNELTAGKSTIIARLQSAQKNDWFGVQPTIGSTMTNFRYKDASFNIWYVNALYTTLIILN
jgi:hypothetical protein